MGDTPWLGDACSLVEEFRAGRRSPFEEMQATLRAVEQSGLNAVSFVDAEGALERARNADVNAPFGGVPLGIKELDHVQGWPATEASVPLADRTSAWTSTMVERLTGAAGANHFGLTTSSEFGGVNITRTVLNGVTRNPWDAERTPGGSSGGSGAAVAGGLFTLGTGGDGGGSIRIPAGFNGLVGLKSTFGRIPRGPRVEYGNLTVTTGFLTFDAADVSLSTTTLSSVRGIVTFDDTLAGKPLLHATTFGADYTTSAGTFAITFAATGVIKATY